MYKMSGSSFITVVSGFWSYGKHSQKPSDNDDQKLVAKHLTLTKL